MKKVRKTPVSSADTALNLADSAERGDTRAAYDLAVMMGPTSVTELLEFIAPSKTVTFHAFDAIADGFYLFRFVKQRRETS